MADKPRMCVVDHYFHQKTKSFSFLLDIVKQYYEVDVYWDYSNAGGPRVPVETINRYDVVFFFQVLNPMRDLVRVRAKMIWMPMYDGMPLVDERWYRLSLLPIKIVCFSKRLYDYVSKFDFDCIYVKYYPEVAAPPKQMDLNSHRVFFWYRGNLRIESVLEALDLGAVDRLEILNLPDPGYKALNRDLLDRLKVNYKLYSEFLSQEEFWKIVSRNNIFVAPRVQEGIGMSFLEAMALGLCVVAYNDSTMNEYIDDGETGYLFSERTAKKISFDSLETVIKNTRKSVLAGREAWIKSIPSLVEFIKSPSRNATGIWVRFATYLIRYFPLDLYLYIKTRYFSKKARIIR